MNVNRTTWLLAMRMRSVYRNLNVQLKEVESECEQDHLASGYEDEKCIQKSENAKEKQVENKMWEIWLKLSNRKFFKLPLERRLHWVSCRLVLELAHVLR